MFSVDNFFNNENVQIVNQKGGFKVVEYKKDALSTQLKDYQEIQTRLARCEESTRSAHHRLNNLELGHHAYEQGDMENHRG